MKDISIPPPPPNQGIEENILKQVKFDILLLSSITLKHLLLDHF